MIRAHRTARPVVSSPRLAPAQLGRIVVARSLEWPLCVLERRVRALESAPRFLELGDRLSIGSLSGRPPLASATVTGPHLLGAVERSGGDLVFRYARPAFDREYRFDEATLAARLPPDDTALARLIGQLRLVTTRNRLTHALVQALIEAQRNYLLSGDPLRLKPLSQAALSARLRASGVCPVDADPSRLSRVLRHLSVRLPNGDGVRLRDLCPKTRELHRRYVAQVIQGERRRIVQAGHPAPLTDREIASAVHSRFGSRLSVRTVAYIRRDLGIPSVRERGRRSGYFAATLAFSPLRSLTLETLCQHVPPEPGVYEIRRPDTPAGAGPIIYLGSARNLLKRLRDHLQGYSNNAPLQAHLCRGARFRYCRVVQDWRGVERALYRAFRATFGAAPLCNRMSP